MKGHLAFEAMNFSRRKMLASLKASSGKFLLGWLHVAFFLFVTMFCVNSIILFAHVPSTAGVDMTNVGSAGISESTKGVIAHRFLQLAEFEGADDGDDSAVLKVGPDHIGTEDNDDPAFEGSLLIQKPAGLPKYSQFFDVGSVDSESRSTSEELERSIASVVHSTGAHSILDCPCSGDMPWMRRLLQSVEADMPLFKYFCVHNDASVLERAKACLQGIQISSMEFKQAEYWRNDSLPVADLVVSWSGLEQLRSSDALSFLNNVRTSAAENVLIGSFKRVSPQNPRYGEWKAMVDAENLNPKRLHDLLRPPFMFSVPSRKFSSLDPRLPMKELHLFKTEHLVNRFA